MDLDGLRPGRTATPTTAEGVAEVIREANAGHEALLLWGGGTRIGIGDAPDRYDVALDLRGLTGIVEYEPADLVVTVRAGTTLAELADALGRNRQRWPVEPGHPELATVGGTVASAAGGPSSLRYFHPRDWTLGVQAVLGDGTVTRAGGRVVKNATGYDLTKLYSGSFGTLCALTELTLKLAAVPEGVLTLRADLVDLAHAYVEVRELLAAHLPLDALAVLTGPTAEAFDAPTWTALWVRVAGTPRVVERLRSEVAARLRCEEVDGLVWDRLAALPLDAGESLRLTWPAGTIEPHPGPAGALLYPGVDALHAFGVADQREIAAVRAELEAGGGAAVLERARPELRSAVGTWGTARAPRAIAQGLKERFDPNGVLAPGRLAY
ncbi:FAD-binding oxidoreductase [soil metagenome]